MTRFQTFPSRNCPCSNKVHVIKCFNARLSKLTSLACSGSCPTNQGSWLWSWNVIRTCLLFWLKRGYYRWSGHLGEKSWKVAMRRDVLSDLLGLAPVIEGWTRLGQSQSDVTLGCYHFQKEGTTHDDEGQYLRPLLLHQPSFHQQQTQTLKLSTTLHTLKNQPKQPPTQSTCLVSIAFSTLHRRSLD